MNTAWDHLLQEAELYAEQGLLDEAIAAYEELLPSLDKEASAKDLREKLLARLAELKERKISGPSALLEPLEGEKPEEGALEEALALKEGGFWEEAIEAFQRLISLGYDSPEAYKNLVELLLESKRYQEALETVKKALSLPQLTIEDHVSLYYQLGLAYEGIQELEKALEAYNKAYHFDSDYLDLAERIQRLKELQRKYGRLQLLFSQGLLSEEIYEEAKGRAQEKNMSLEAVLIEDFGIPKEAIGRALSSYYGYPFIEFNELEVGPKPLCLKGIKENFFRENVCVPIAEEDGRVILAIDDPSDTFRLDLIRRVLKAEEFEIRVALREDINKFIGIVTA